MRIALLMASAGSRAGGLETITRAFAEGLAARGHAVTLVTGRGPGAPLHDDLRAGDLPYRVRTAHMLGQASFPAQMLGRLRGIHPSVVESRTFWAVARRNTSLMNLLQASTVVAAFYEVEAVAASADLSVPMVYYYAGPIDPRRLAHGRFSRVVAISHMVADYHAGLIDRIALPRVDAVVHPGVAEAHIADGPAPGVGVLDPETLFTGRLDVADEKRAGKLVEWWPEVTAAVPGARLTLAGGGTNLPHLRQLVDAAGLGKVVDLPGPLPHSALYARLQRAGLFAFPSLLETFGVAPLEALAAGLPVVASDIAGLRESLGDAALLLPVDDEAGWVRTLIRMLTDATLRVGWAARGPAYARRFTWTNQSAQFEAQLVAAVQQGYSSGGAGVARANSRSV